MSNIETMFIIASPENGDEGDEKAVLFVGHPGASKDDLLSVVYDVDDEAGVVNFEDPIFLLGKFHKEVHVEHELVIDMDANSGTTTDSDQMFMQITGEIGDMQSFARMVELLAFVEREYDELLHKMKKHAKRHFQGLSGKATFGDGSDLDLVGYCPEKPLHNTSG